MGKKFFYILTVLLFSISAANADDATKTLFPMDGGTTSDGIIISKPTIDGFEITATSNKINAERLELNSNLFKSWITLHKFKNCISVFPSESSFNEPIYFNIDK